MQVRLSAPNISCKSCAAAITNTLGKLQGVQQVTVDVAAKIVDVQYDENLADLDTILHRLHNAGFPATKV